MKAYIQSTFNFPNNTLKFDIKLPFDKSLNNIKFSLINQIYKFLNYKKEYYNIMNMDVQSNSEEKIA